MANEKKSDFVVTDRRKFTLDGEPRPDAPEEREEPAAPPAPEPPKAAEPKAQKPQAPPPPPQEPAAPNAAMPETGYDADNQRTEFGGQKIEFVHILDMLVQTAMMYAGALDQGPERRVDVVGMRQMIDMISVLEQKTKGNLTAEEQTMMSNVLFQLRMTYMEIINMIDKQATQGPNAPKK